MSELSCGFPCPHCGAAMPLPLRLIKDFPGRTITRWCIRCHKLFDVVMPAKEEDATQSPP
jgi:hypothetical protein